MSQHDTDELSQTERRALAALPRQLAPPSTLEERTVRALIERGLVRASGAQSPRARLSLMALGGLTAAAALVIGMTIGWWFTRPTTPPTSGEQFMLLLYEDEAFQHSVAGRPQQHLVREYGEWAGALRDQERLLAAEKLAVDGRLLARVRDEVQVSVDVSATPHGIVAGFFIITARDYDEAVAVASRSPHLRYGGRIAIRRIEPT